MTRSRSIKEQIDKSSLIKMFFWDDDNPPQKFVDIDRKPVEKLMLAGALSLGWTLNSYRGIARCRFPTCGVGLGSSDMTYAGYLFPSGCEHYVLKHSVWVPEANDFIQKALESLRLNSIAEVVMQSEEFRNVTRGK